jgi:hypothetical protein
MHYRRALAQEIDILENEIELRPLPICAPLTQLRQTRDHGGHALLYVA